MAANWYLCNDIAARFLLFRIDAPAVSDACQTESTIWLGYQHSSIDKAIDQQTSQNDQLKSHRQQPIYF